MKFVEMPEVLTGARSWGCFDGTRSYVIGFDERHPGGGYSSLLTAATRIAYLVAGELGHLTNVIGRCDRFRR